MCCSESSERYCAWRLLWTRQHRLTCSRAFLVLITFYTENAPEGLQFFSLNGTIWWLKELKTSRSGDRLIQEPSNGLHSYFGNQKLCECFSTNNNKAAQTCTLAGEMMSKATPFVLWTAFLRKQQMLIVMGNAPVFSVWLSSNSPGRIAFVRVKVYSLTLWNSNKRAIFWTNNIFRSDTSEMECPCSTKKQQQKTTEFSEFS